MDGNFKIMHCGIFINMPYLGCDPIIKQQLDQVLSIFACFGVAPPRLVTPQEKWLAEGEQLLCRQNESNLINTTAWYYLPVLWAAWLVVYRCDEFWWRPLCYWLSLRRSLSDQAWAYPDPKTRLSETNPTPRIPHLLPKCIIKRYHFIIWTKHCIILFQISFKSYLHIHVL